MEIKVKSTFFQILNDFHLSAIVPSGLIAGSVPITISTLNGGPVATLNFTVVRPDSLTPSCSRLGLAGAQFTLLADNLIFNVGGTLTNGNVGVTNGTSIIGFPQGTIFSPGTLHIGGTSLDPLVIQAQRDLQNAYDVGSNLTPTTTINKEFGRINLIYGRIKSCRF